MSSNSDLSSESFLSSVSLEIISRVFPHLRLEIKSEWSDGSPTTRSNLRTRLLAHARTLGLEFSKQEVDSFLDLSNPPRHPQFQCSISHCPGAGGWIFSQSYPSLGFDLEVSLRPQEPTVARISSPRELAGAPSAAHLWVAKEAAFKALAQSLPVNLLSQVETLH